MAINKSRPMKFTPRGLVDAYDATDEFVGAAQQLSNLIFDPSNPEVIIARPGVELLVDFRTQGVAPKNLLWGDGSLWGDTTLFWGMALAGGTQFTNPGFISIHVVVGTRVYGMIGTDRFPGYDEPFCYDTATGFFVPIFGVTSSNVPKSQSSIGEWTPPTMASVGVMILITHPGYSGVNNNFFGIIDTTNSAALQYSSANVLINPLTDVPTAVANFNNRPWFSYAGNRLADCDVLTNPPTRTNAYQFLVLGDYSPINALSGLPITTTSSGILGSLTVFKQTQCWQITGDRTTNDLAENYISLTVGTNAPRSVVQSTLGIYFQSTGGPYYIDPLGTLRPLTNSLQTLYPDIVEPFQNAQTPTRWAAAYNSSIYRVCGDTVVRGLQMPRDYWFDERKRRWNGPHTFIYDCASALAGNFVLSADHYPGQLLISSPYQTLNSVYTDIDSEYQTTLLTSTFPKTNDEMMKQVAESTIELTAQTENVIYDITAQDEQSNTLGHVLMGGGQGGSYWNQFDWDDGTLWSTKNINLWGGGGLWGSYAEGGSNLYWRNTKQIPSTYPVYWTSPLVFDKMQLLVTSTASAQLGIGTFYARYQQTGYQAWRSINIFIGATDMGTVTSVALIEPVEFIVNGSPITTSGTFTVTKAAQLPNTVWAGPIAGGAAQPTFRALVSADLPAIPGNNGSYWAFGNGADGAVVFDGTNTFSFANKISSTRYVLLRPIYCTDCTINAGIEVTTFDMGTASVGGGQQVFCTGTLTVNGSLNCDGQNPSVNKYLGGMGGANQSGVNTIYGAGANGGLAGSFAGGNGTSRAGSFGGAGGAGAASSSSNAGGTGGTVTAPVGSNSGGVNALWLLTVMLSGRLPIDSVSLTQQFFGGAGGGAGGGVPSVGQGGGGGGGGGVLGVFARYIAAASGRISCNGSTGSPGNWQGSGAGSGGGGGGGVLLIATTTANFTSLVTCQAEGGISPTAGGRPGTNGSAGTFAYLIL